jgi:hypothetical protein
VVEGTEMKQSLVQECTYEKQARALENTSFKQITHDVTNGRNGRCAIGVLMEYHVDQEMPVEIRGKIIALNDVDNLSFSEIAAWLRNQ